VLNVPGPPPRPVAAATISVVVPCYNAAPYVRDAVLSVLAQTRAPMEVLVIDDGSTDGSAAVIHAIDDPRVHYHHQPNAGVAAARNLGLDRARGDFVGFLDADDTWRPLALEVLASMLESSPDIVCAFADFERFDEATGRIIGTQLRLYPELARLPTRPLPRPNSFRLEGDAFSELIRYSDVPAFSSGMLYRRTAASAVHFDPSLRVCEDMAFFLRVLLHGTVAFSREVLCDVRRHPGNLTKDYNRIPIHKLQALQAIAPHVIGADRQRLFRNRLVRALLDVACLKLSDGDTGQGWATYGKALVTPGSSVRKVRALPRLLHAWLAARRRTAGVRERA
jgi:glycosyltransferase involved in cell wall biosynthesis